MKKIEQIKEAMMDALERPFEDSPLELEYVYHEDIPEFDATFDEWFTVCGERESPVYFVGIKKINI